MSECASLSPRSVCNIAFQAHGRAFSRGNGEVVYRYSTLGFIWHVVVCEIHLASTILYYVYRSYNAHIRWDSGISPSRLAVLFIVRLRPVNELVQELRTSDFRYRELGLCRVLVACYVVCECSQVMHAACVGF